MRHKFLVLPVKKWLKSVHIYGSYRKNKTGVPFFWNTRYSALQMYSTNVLLLFFVHNCYILLIKLSFYCIHTCSTLSPSKPMNIATFRAWSSVIPFSTLMGSVSIESGSSRACSSMLIPPCELASITGHYTNTAAYQQYTAEQHFQTVIVK